MVSRRRFLINVMGTAVTLGAGSQALGQLQSKRPNIIFILTDDVGYGDLVCYGATKVRTPNIDQLAQQGVRFLDAHSTASVCTPSRYSFLTGEYAWRNPLGDHILSGVEPLSIDPTKPTVAAMLGKSGYRTGLVGKWHLGLGTKEQPVDYNQDIKPGPLDVGFDYAFFYPATNDRVPCVYIENRRVVGLDPSDPIRVSYKEKVGDEPTGEEHPESLKMKADASHSKTIVDGISRIGYMAGGKTAHWVDEDMADTLARKAVSFIEQNRARPFFLYFALHDIHEPMAPHPRFKGTSDCGTRGDAIHEMDWCFGEVMAALDRLGLAENTLVIFTSDNGGAIKDTYDDGTNELHGRQAPNGPLRGQKGTNYEGGHRIPFIARWPGHIEPGTTSNQLIGLVDMMATFCAVAGENMPADGGPDSVNVLPALLGKKDSPVRDHLVLQSGRLALRQGPWILIEKNRGKKGGIDGELYNLDSDLTETHDVAAEYPDRVKEMAALLEKIRTKRRS